MRIYRNCNYNHQQDVLEVLELTGLACPVLLNKGEQDKITLFSLMTDSIAHIAHSTVMKSDNPDVLWKLI